jgi:hypothetical protein
LEAVLPRVWFFSGPESEYWRTWIAAFKPCKSHPDQRVRRVVELALENLGARLQASLDAERMENIRGIGG